MEKLVEVLKWFKNINNKNMFTFMKFDVQFYHSISKILFINSIEFAKKLLMLVMIKSKLFFIHAKPLYSLMTNVG